MDKLVLSKTWGILESLMPATGSNSFLSREQQAEHVRAMSSAQQHEGKQLRTRCFSGALCVTRGQQPRTPQTGTARGQTRHKEHWLKLGLAPQWYLGRAGKREAAQAWAQH